ncbi:MAG TPA: FimV/HubP family polar landmark protein [Chiayiivirga sp.]|nr:FimV/HubP family polar landmark protein [Chiayiivirga sp.]
MNKPLRLSMALALALAGSGAQALGLGQIEVKSALNQPLVAEIPVLVSNPGEADALRVSLAAPEAFARVGLDRPALAAANLAFEVVKDGGRTSIRITTPNSVSDPFLSFLLEVDWGNGKMVREYTVLLDPPSMMPVASAAPTTVAAISEPEPAQVEPLLETPPPMVEPAPAPPPVAEAPAVAEAAPAQPSAAETLDNMDVAAATPTSAPAPVSGSYGPVASGETLWAIANAARPDASVSINQMMLALLRANPDAFIGNNINRLKKGAVLRIPGREEATTLAAIEAAAQVREQMQSWQGAVATTAQPATGSETAPRTTSRAGSGAADSRLELTPPRGKGEASASTSGAAADGSGRELRAELARSKEEVSALSQENQELKSRVGELEDLQSESRRLIELKDSELAAAQRSLREANQRAEQEKAAASASAAAGATSATDVSSTPESASPVAVAPDQAVSEPAAAVGADAAVADAESSIATPLAETAPAATTTETAPAAPVADPATDTAEQTAATESAPESSGWFGFSPWLVGGGAAVLLGLLGVLGLSRRTKSDAKRPASPAPFGSATPAVASFEPNQEEGELIEAISQHPDDLHLHLDLLRHYVATSDAVGFEMAAEAMYAQVRNEHEPAWQEARELGQHMAPDHPLFAQSIAAAAAPTADVEAATRVVGAKALDASAVTDELPAVTVPVESLEEDALWDEPVAEAEAHDDFIDDEVFTSAAPAAQAHAVDDDPDLIDSDAATTKLELARAYLDMGDAEGARGMLEEVLTEGTSAQRDEARQLLADIG